LFYEETFATASTWLSPTQRRAETLVATQEYSHQTGGKCGDSIGCTADESAASWLIRAKKQRAGI
jgi:hypothetical protein